MGENEYTKLFISAFVGASFGFLSNIFVNWLKRRRIEKTIKLFLIESILSNIEKIKDEAVIVSRESEVYSFNALNLTMFPTFNASILKTFPMNDMQAIYKSNFNSIINIIGYLDNIQNRFPHIYHKNFVDYVDNHLATNTEKFDSKKEHFYNCENLKNYRKILKGNLENVSGILDDLKNEIETILYIK